MPSITLMMSLIFLRESLMPFMVSTTWATTSPPWTATVEALCASWLAWRGVVGVLLDGGAELFHGGGGFFQRAGLLSVRATDRWLPWAISALAVATLSEPWRTLVDHLGQTVLHGLHRPQQLTDLVAAFGLDVRCQVAGGDGFCHSQCLRQRGR